MLSIQDSVKETFLTLFLTYSFLRLFVLAKLTNCGKSNQVTFILYIALNNTDFFSAALH